jgi:hypothetical protein
MPLTVIAKLLLGLEAGSRVGNGLLRARMAVSYQYRFPRTKTRRKRRPYAMPMTAAIKATSENRTATSETPPSDYE